MCKSDSVRREGGRKTTAGVLEGFAPGPSDNQTPHTPHPQKKSAGPAAKPNLIKKVQPESPLFSTHTLHPPSSPGIHRPPHKKPKHTQKLKIEKMRVDLFQKSIRESFTETPPHFTRTSSSAFSIATLVLFIICAAAIEYDRDFSASVSPFTSTSTHTVLIPTSSAENVRDYTLL